VVEHVEDEAIGPTGGPETWATVGAVGNQWLERRVLAYAHRGGAREAPSNTIFAMRRALAAGATALEMDVHPTADGHLVVCHDPTVDRTTNGSGAISSLTLAEVQALDAAHWFVPGHEVAPGRPPGDYPLRGRAPDDVELRVPTLREVLEAFPGVLLNLDIKQTAPSVKPYEAAVARMLMDYDRSDDVIVTSFQDAALVAFSAAAPRVATSAGLLAVAGFWRAVQDGAPSPPMTHAAIQVPTDFEGATIVDERFVAAAHAAGAAVHVWTIDDRSEMERLVALRVDGIMSDLPSVLVPTLAELGVAWTP
jgi:glycerophosphoryl diester phosphodiesterase